MVHAPDLQRRPKTQSFVVRQVPPSAGFSAQRPARQPYEQQSELPAQAVPTSKQEAAAPVFVSSPPILQAATEARMRDREEEAGRHGGAHRRYERPRYGVYAE